MTHLGKTFFLILILFTEIGIFIWNAHTLIFLLLIGPAVLIFSVAGTAKKIFSINDEKNANAAAMKKAQEEGREYMEKLQSKLAESQQDADPEN